MTVQRLSSFLFLAGAVVPLVVSAIFNIPPIAVAALLVTMAVAAFRICLIATRDFPDRWWWWPVPLNILPALWGLMASQVAGADLKPYLVPAFMIGGSLLGSFVARKKSGKLSGVSFSDR